MKLYHTSWNEIDRLGHAPIWFALELEHATEGWAKTDPAKLGWVYEGIVWRDAEDSDYVRCDKSSVAIQEFAKKYECYTARNFPLKFNPWPPVER
jgi:hypothetical protein